MSSVLRASGRAGHSRRQVAREVNASVSLPPTRSHRSWTTVTGTALRSHQNVHGPSNEATFLSCRDHPSWRARVDIYPQIVSASVLGYYPSDM
ncbi:hypothetical protein PM082_003514 [Marasmius tenuissimus]|nr:hypothetical protein PM082_003514 [Marasmius tenuissimus]